jgi:hypothetical protein
MGVAVKHDVNRIARERLLQPAAAKVGIDLRRLSLNGCGDR